MNSLTDLRRAYTTTFINTMILLIEAVSVRFVGELEENIQGKLLNEG